MAIWRILIIVCSSWVITESKRYPHHKREALLSICDPLGDNVNKVQCYCTRNSLKQDEMKNAECFLTSENVKEDDPIWNNFNLLQNLTKLTLTNTKGILLKYVPTKALEETKALTKLTIKYESIEKIQGYAFANLTNLEDITVRDNNIKTLETNAFAHLKKVTSIGLDTNDIEEINRDVFVDLPLLEKLFLTGNKITTIHDRAFIHLSNLRDLEIDKNKLFSLNSETFSGLHKLKRLDLSGNSLEVIGANTFIHLHELHLLNLDGNHIQMLDEKAFNGLGKLHSLSLAHNKLTEIENVKTFEGLIGLKTLNLKLNMIRLMKAEVIAPILENFYGPTSYLDFDDNNFPCDCNIDWFITIKNKTKNNLLKNSLTNVKCHPSDAIREAWKGFADADKNDAPGPEEEEPQAQNVEYEYYDDSQLNGTLFYTDIRFLLNCTNNDVPNIQTPGSNLKPIESTTARFTTKPTISTSSYKPDLTTTSSTTTSTTTVAPTTTSTHSTKVINQGLLDLSSEERTTEIPKMITDSVRKVEVTSEKKISPTTNRLASVSAKPIDKGYDDHDMASDEAKPDKLKSDRSYQEEINHTEGKINSSHRNFGRVSMLISIIIMLSLRSFL